MSIQKLFSFFRNIFLCCPFIIIIIIIIIGLFNIAAKGWIEQYALSRM